MYFDMEGDDSIRNEEAFTVFIKFVKVEVF